MTEEEKLFRQLLGPALPVFRRDIAAKWAVGATEKEIEAYLSEIESGMRSMDNIPPHQLEVFMRIYRSEAEAARTIGEADAGLTDEERIKADAREIANATLGPVFEALREGFAEERQKGATEAEIQSKVRLVCASVEREQRGKIPDHVVDEMILMTQEAAMPPNKGPGTVQ